VPPPRILPAFPNARRVKPKTAFQGGLRTRWKDADDYIYEWDYLHGMVEKYSRRGNHLGEFDPKTGEQTKEPEPGRSIFV
jgi:hypothetical protein